MSRRVASFSDSICISDVCPFPTPWAEGKSRCTAQKVMRYSVWLLAFCPRSLRKPFRPRPSSNFTILPRSAAMKNYKSEEEDGDISVINWPFSLNRFNASLISPYHILCSSSLFLPFSWSETKGKKAELFSMPTRPKSYTLTSSSWSEWMWIMCTWKLYHVCIVLQALWDSKLNSWIFHDIQGPIDRRRITGKRRERLASS